MPIVLIAAGVTCVAAGVIHGYLGQTRLIGLSVFPSPRAKAFVSVIWQFSAVTWVICGMVIAASPWLFEDRTRLFGVICACLPLIWGLIGNAWASRGQHFGWMVLAVVVALALVGVVA